MKYKEVLLGDIADVQWGDTSTTKAKYTNDGYKAFSASGNDGNLPYYDYDREGIVLSAIGAACGRFWYTSGKWSCIKNTIRFWSIDENICLTKYLFYAINPKSWIISGSAQPFITLKSARNYRLRLPDLETQKKIVRILSVLDQKIELNNSNSRVLYSLAESIFKERFKDKKYGDGTVGDYIMPKRGKALLSKDTIEGSVPVVAGGLEAAARHNKSNTSAPVVTISASGANAGFVRLWGEKVWSSDSSFIDDSITKNVYFWYVLLKSRQKEIYDAQTGSAQAHIYPKHIADMPIGNISDEEISKYNNLVTPMFEKIALNDAANMELSAIRDSLLPKLMSGEISLDKVVV